MLIETKIDQRPRSLELEGRHAKDKTILAQAVEITALRDRVRRRSKPSWPGWHRPPSRSGSAPAGDVR